MFTIPSPQKLRFQTQWMLVTLVILLEYKNYLTTTLKLLEGRFSSYSFTDDETRSAMKKIHSSSGYVSDPHGAVGYLGLKKYGLKENEFGIFLGNSTSR